MQYFSHWHLTSVMPHAVQRNSRIMLPSVRRFPHYTAGGKPVQGLGGFAAATHSPPAVNL
jgi:hypothetical protein